MKRLLLIFFILVISISSHAQKTIGRGYRDSLINSYVGKQYPAFNFTTTKGEIISSETTKGKVVLLNFWFKDCSPCRTEMEWLNVMYDSLRNNKDFQFISIAREEMAVLPGYINFFHLNYPVVGLIECDKYNIGGGFPKNIILDKQGKIVHIIGGGNPDRAKAKIEVLENLYGKIKELL